MAGQSTHPTIPGDVRSGVSIAIDHSSWTEAFEGTVLSDPSYEHVGLFDAEIIERLVGDVWMFSAAEGIPNHPVLVVGGDSSAYVAFSEAAARHGACHRIGLDSIEIG